MIRLVEDTIDNDDINSLIEWLKTYPRLTKGPLTEELEEKFAKWVGTNHSVFVNSGSSANLLMIAALLESGKLEKGDKVIVPALAWATDLAPIIQLGLEPILCDCNLQNLSIDLGHLHNLIRTEKPKALMLVSVLGLVPDMISIIELCNKHDIILLEDACESLGSKYVGQKLGTFGLMSSFSTYFGHHISTIEGGFICTNNEKIYNILKSLRSHGWDRDVDVPYQRAWRLRNNIDDFNALYTFYVPGFNLRSTDLQAFIGLKQLDKLKKLCNIRFMNFVRYQKSLKVGWFPKFQNINFISNMAFPIIHERRDEIVKELQENDVEVRPLIAGSLGKQPVYVQKYGELSLPNADIVNDFGFYVPNHPSLSDADIDKIVTIINQYK